MVFKKVTAIVRGSALEAIEQALQAEGVRGLTVSPVAGYGQYANYFRKDLMAHHLRVEVVTDAGHVDAVTRAIIDTAHCGSAGDGLIMVESLDSVLRVRSKCAPSADDL